MQMRYAIYGAHVGEWQSYEGPTALTKVNIFKTMYRARIFCIHNQPLSL